jgi:hypothetical protein
MPQCPASFNAAKFIPPANGSREGNEAGANQTKDSSSEERAGSKELM